MKIGLISLGCPKNLVDSEVMLGLAREAGHELTQDPAGADVLVVNTCAFIDRAKQESVDTILEMAQHKKDGGCKRLIVTGCLAERYRDEADYTAKARAAAARLVAERYLLEQDVERVVETATARYRIATAQ